MKMFRTIQNKYESCRLFLGIPYKIKKLKNGYEKKYIFGIRYSKKRTNNEYYRVLLGETNEEIFSTIYSNNIWGGNNGEFYSGPGSHKKHLTHKYIELLKDFLYQNKIDTIVEIGCGDFHIMNQILDSKFNYIGIDVVKKLIHRNLKMFGSEKVDFIYGDAADSKFVLPKGDVLVIREVLQHLENKDIIEILNKSKKFKYVLVTEHIYIGSDVIYNIDKPTNDSIRTHQKSGVFVEKPPFNLKNTETLISIPHDNIENSVLRTTLVTNCFE